MKNWKTRRRPRHKKDWKSFEGTPGSWKPIQVHGLERPMRHKRVRKYFAKFLTRLEQKIGRKAAREAFSAWAKCPDAQTYRPALWQINRRKSAYATPR